MAQSTKLTIEQIKRDIRRRARHEYTPLPYEALFRHEAELAYRHDILKLAVAPPSNSWKDRVRVFFKQVLARGLRWILMRQVEFNRVTLDHFREYSEALTLLDQRLREMSVQVSKLRRKLEAVDRRPRVVDLTPDLEACQQRLQAQEETTADVVDRLERQFKTYDDHVTALRSQMSRLGRRLSAPEPDLNFDYVHFQNEFRGSRAEIRQRQQVYLDDLRGVGPVVDLGCGRGELVELLHQSGVPVTGVDSDAAMVDFCHEIGLPVVEEDLFKYLQSLQDHQMGGIFCSQVVEHLKPAKVFELLETCRAKLSSGGVLIVETVNPLCVGALCNFWLDPTHERPIHPLLLHHVLTTMGFRDLQYVYSAPTGGESSTCRSREFSDEVASHYQDFAIVARK